MLHTAAGHRTPGERQKSQELLEPIVVESVLASLQHGALQPNKRIQNKNGRNKYTSFQQYCSIRLFALPSMRHFGAPLRRRHGVYNWLNEC